MKGINTPTQGYLAGLGCSGGRPGLPRTRGLRLGHGVWRGASLGLCGLWLALGAAIPAAAQDFGGATVPDQVWTVGIAESLTLPAATGATSYTLTYNAAALPTGLNFADGTRVLSGTLSAAVADLTMTYSAIDGTNSAELLFNFTGVRAPTFFEQQVDLTAEVGNGFYEYLSDVDGGAEPLSYTLMSTEDPSRTVVDAAPGLAFNAGNELFGTPRLTFSQDFVHTVEDVNGATAVQTFTITAVVDNTPPDLSYTAPGTLAVGVAITPLAPITDALNSNLLSSDILSFSLSGDLPTGLAFRTVTGIISGTPTTATTDTATVTLGVIDRNGNNSDSYALTFPTVSKGAQELNRFDYRPRLVEVRDTVTLTPPEDSVGELSFSSADSNVCTVDVGTGALTLAAEGDCVITATALETENYNAGTASVTVIVLANDAVEATEIENQFPTHMRSAIITALGLGRDSFEDREVAELTELSFEGDGDDDPDDIRGLRYFTGLTFLSLRNLDIFDADDAASGADNSSLRHIAGLTQLTGLEVPNAHSTEWASLKGLVNLEYLDISGNQGGFANIEALLENPGIDAGDRVKTGAVPFAALATVLDLEAKNVEVEHTNIFQLNVDAPGENRTVAAAAEHLHRLTISEPIEVEVQFESPDTAVATVELRRVGSEENLEEVSTVANQDPPLNVYQLHELLEPGEYAIRFINRGSDEFSYSITVETILDEDGFKKGMELRSDESGSRLFSYTDSANEDLVVTVVGLVNPAMTFAEGVASVGLPAFLGDLGGATRAYATVDFIPVATGVAPLPAEYSFEGLSAADYPMVDINFYMRPVSATPFDVRVCLPVTANLSDNALPVLLHYTADAWTRIEESRYDADNSRICAILPRDDFSPFAVGAVERPADRPDLVGMELRSDQSRVEFDYTYDSEGADVVVVGVVTTEADLELPGPGFASVGLPANPGTYSGDTITVAVTFSAVDGTFPPIPQTFTHTELSDNYYTQVDIALIVRPDSVANFKVDVCLPVARDLSSLVRPVLLHYTSNAWSQVEEAIFDVGRRRICAMLPRDDFSPFAVGAGEERIGLNQEQRSDLLKRTVGAMSRSTAQTVVNIISSRLGAAPQDKAQAQVAGYSLRPDDWRDSFARQFYADAKALGQGKDLHLADALSASGFTLPLLDQGVTLWGAVGGMQFEGNPEDSILSTEYDGEVSSVLFGVDGEVGENRRLGVALGFSDGDLEYTGTAGAVSESGDIEQSMIGVYPYLSWRPVAGLNLWALGGYGVGEYDISKQPLNGELDQADGVDATQWMLALGGEQEILLGSQWDDNWDAKVRIKGLWNVLELDDVVFESGDEVADFETNTWRWAVENEYGYRISLGDGASIRPYGLVGLRWDGGDATADDELFVDASGGVAFKSSAGLALDVAFRAQLSQDDAEEYALSGTGSLSYDSGQDGRGLQLAVKRSMVGFSGFDALGSSWNAYDFSAPTADVSPSDVGARMETELGYAWALQPLHVMRPGVLQTYLRSTFQDADRRHAVGFNFRTSTLDLILEAAHHQPSSEPGLSSSSPVEARLKAHLRF